MSSLDLRAPNNTQDNMEVSFNPSKTKDPKTPQPDQLDQNFTPRENRETPRANEAHTPKEVSKDLHSLHSKIDQILNPHGTASTVSTKKEYISFDTTSKVAPVSQLNTQTVDSAKLESLRKSYLVDDTSKITSLSAFERSPQYLEILKKVYLKTESPVRASTTNLAAVTTTSTLAPLEKRVLSYETRSVNVEPIRTTGVTMGTSTSEARNLSSKIDQILGNSVNQSYVNQSVYNRTSPVRTTDFVNYSTVNRSFVDGTSSVRTNDIVISSPTKTVNVVRDHNVGLSQRLDQILVSTTPAVRTERVVYSPPRTNLNLSQRVERVVSPVRTSHVVTYSPTRTQVNLPVTTSHISYSPTRTNFNLSQRVVERVVSPVRTNHVISYSPTRTHVDLPVTTSHISYSPTRTQVNLPVTTSHVVSYSPTRTVNVGLSQQIDRALSRSMVSPVNRSHVVTYSPTRTHVDLPVTTSHISYSPTRTNFNLSQRVVERVVSPVRTNHVISYSPTRTHVDLPVTTSHISYSPTRTQVNLPVTTSHVSYSPTRTVNVGLSQQIDRALSRSMVSPVNRSHVVTYSPTRTVNVSQNLYNSSIHTHSNPFLTSSVISPSTVTPTYGLYKSDVQLSHSALNPGYDSAKLDQILGRSHSVHNIHHSTVTQPSFKQDYTYQNQHHHSGCCCGGSYCCGDVQNDGDSQVFDDEEELENEVSTKPNSQSEKPRTKRIGKKYENDAEASKKPTRNQREEDELVAKSPYDQKKRDKITPKQAKKYFEDQNNIRDFDFDRNRSKY